MTFFQERFGIITSDQHYLLALCCSFRCDRRVCDHEAQKVKLLCLPCQNAAVFYVVACVNDLAAPVHARCEHVDSSRQSRCL